MLESETRKPIRFPISSMKDAGYYIDRLLRMQEKTQIIGNNFKIRQPYQESLLFQKVILETDSWLQQLTLSKLTL
ncbi:MAG: hypothetical protein CSA50_00980 [Gammaproteobacteria bacterium]|nr:MAG: hypothetical protein CSA50_00980 [Gammaproteobacteria bacterium]